MSSLFGGTFLLCPKVVMFIVRFSEACEKLKFKGWICEECQQGQRPVQPEGWIRMGILDYGDQWWEYTARTLCAKMLWEWPDNSGTGWTLELYRGLSFWRPIDANWDGFCFQCSVQPFFFAGLGSMVVLCQISHVKQTVDCWFPMISPLIVWGFFMVYDPYKKKTPFLLWKHSLFWVGQIHIFPVKQIISATCWYWLYYIYIICLLRLYAQITPNP